MEAPAAEPGAALTIRGELARCTSAAPHLAGETCDLATCDRDLAAVNDGGCNEIGVVDGRGDLIGEAHLIGERLRLDPKCRPPTPVTTKVGVGGVNATADAEDRVGRAGADNRGCLRVEHEEGEAARGEGEEARPEHDGTPGQNARALLTCEHDLERSGLPSPE